MRTHPEPNLVGAPLSEEKKHTVANRPTFRFQDGSRKFIKALNNSIAKGGNCEQ
jgi:hypothetical protein